MPYPTPPHPSQRYVGYFSYRRPWFEADTHFEATRSLYHGPDKPSTSFPDKQSGGAGGAGYSTVASSPPSPPPAAGFTAGFASTSGVDADLGSLVRGEFPGLLHPDHAGRIFCDGAGGSQVHQTVISAMTEQMVKGSANLGPFINLPHFTLLWLLLATFVATCRHLSPLFASFSPTFRQLFGAFLHTFHCTRIHPPSST